MKIDDLYGPLYKIAYAGALLGGFATGHGLVRTAQDSKYALLEMLAGLLVTVGSCYYRNRRMKQVHQSLLRNIDKKVECLEQAIEKINKQGDKK